MFTVHGLLPEEFFEFFVQLVFVTANIAGMSVNDIAFAVQEKRLGDGLEVEQVLEFSCGMGQDGVVPSFLADNGLDLGQGAGIVGGNGDDLQAVFFFPFRVQVSHVGKFEFARLAPGGPKADQCGVPALGEGLQVHGLALQVIDLSVDREDLGLSHSRKS